MGAWSEIGQTVMEAICSIVAPLVGAWIEIGSGAGGTGSDLVAPLVGAWIEIALCNSGVLKVTSSLPSWERGLKFLKRDTGCR